MGDYKKTAISGLENKTQKKGWKYEKSFVDKTPG